MDYKKTIKAFSCLCICALISFGCNKKSDPVTPDPDPDPEPVPEVKHFDVSVTDISVSTCVLNIVRDDQTKPIYVATAIQSYVNELAPTLKESAVQYYLGNVEAYEEWGYTKEEAVAELCYNSDIVDGSVEYLNGSTDYYVIVGYVTEEGDPDGDFECYAFKTEAPEPSANTFEVNITDIEARTANISVKASNSDPFSVAVFRTSELPDYTDKDEIVQWIYGENGWFPVYTDEYSEINELKGGVEYAVLVFGCVENAASTEITKKVFTTKASGDPTKLTFTATREDGEVQGFESTFTITPSDDTVDYIFELVNADCTAQDLLDYENGMIEKMATLGLDREGFFYLYSSYGADYQTYTVYPGEKGKIGVIPIKNGELEFACDPIFSEVFTFPEAKLGEATVDISWDKYYDGAAIAEINPDYSYFGTNAVFPITISTTGVKYFYNVYRADGKTYAREDLIYTILSGTYAFYEADCYVPFATDGLFYAFAIDENGVCGPVLAKPFRFEKDGVSDPQEYIDSHSYDYYSASKKKSPVFESAKRAFPLLAEDGPVSLGGVYKKK